MKKQHTIRSILSVLVYIFLLLINISCQPSIHIDREEFFNKVNDSMAEVESMSMTLTVVVNVPTEGTVVIKMKMDVNIVEVLARMEIKMKMQEFGSSQSEEHEALAYMAVENDFAVVYYNSEGSWYKEYMPLEEEPNFTGTYINLAEFFKDAKVGEIVDKDFRAYRFKGKISSETLRKALSDENDFATAFLVNLMFGAKGSIDAELLIEKDTYYIRKIYFDLSSVMKNMIEISSGEKIPNLKAYFTIEFGDFNNVNDIVIPEEARTAMTIEELATE